jgi:methylmalonyl-CoA/ethylmalonyl-CoA epimerase
VEALAALPDEAKLDKKFRIGAGGCHIAFMHPKVTGLLLELTERPGGPSF